MSSFSLFDDDDFGAITFSTSSLKTDLFTKNAQLERFQKELDQILVMPDNQRKRWVKQHELFIHRTMDQLVQDSLLVLEAVDGDFQEMELSMEFVKRLQEVMTVLSTIMYGTARTQ